MRQIYEKFDCDHDGKISFEDLKQSVGKVINPVADLYFRAEVNQRVEIVSCSVPGCTFMKVGFMNLC
jgi:hypothetical protein